MTRSLSPDPRSSSDTAIAAAGTQVNPSKARTDGLTLLALGAAVFLSLGIAVEILSPSATVDFKTYYYTARCLIGHGDPYNQVEVLRVYRASVAEREEPSPRAVPVIVRLIYLPSVFAIAAPVALLPFAPAHWLWIAINAGSLLLAAFLIWDAAADLAPALAGLLIGFLLANSELIIMTGNAAGMSIGLCGIAVWCFLRNRYVAIGILCLAISLAMKPHDTGLIWLYFLLAGGIGRKRALQSLATLTALTLPMLIWVQVFAPHWVSELRANIASFSGRGSISDPGPASSGAHRLGMMVNMQTAVSFFRDDPRVYNTVTYVICAVLLLVWAAVTIRSRWSPERMWIALSSVSTLTLLPVYHRQLDVKTLLFTIPACAILWAKGKRIGKAALVVTLAGLVFTGEMSWVIALGILDHIPLPNTALWNEVLTGVQILPAPLSLLAVGVFYLWVYARDARPEESAIPAKATMTGQP